MVVHDTPDEEAYAKHADALVRFATGLVGPADAPDVVSDAVISAMTSRRWPSIDNRRAYLYRSVLNQARMHHRSTMRRRARELRAAPAESVDMPEIRPDVLEAVGRLSPRQRAAVFLTYWEGLTPPEVAACLGVSEGSVRRHLARARNRLRGLLDD